MRRLMMRYVASRCYNPALVTRSINANFRNHNTVDGGYQQSVIVKNVPKPHTPRQPQDRKSLIDTETYLDQVRTILTANDLQTTTWQVLQHPSQQLSP
jgi:hypothetical protein